MSHRQGTTATGNEHRDADMARINRSEVVANAGLRAGANSTVRARAPIPRNVQTVGDLVRRLPRLFVIAASVAAVIVIAVAHM